MNQFGVCRFYLPMLRALSQSGKEIHLFFTHIKVLKNKTVEGATLVEEARQLPGVTVHFDVLPGRRDRWATFMMKLRDLRDVIRYYHPDYRKAHKLRQRMERIAAGNPGGEKWVERLRKVYRVGGYPALKGLEAGIRLVDWAMPSCPSIDRFFNDVSPDLVLFSRLLDPHCPQKEYLKSARILGIPTGICVASWDNLTNKGLMQIRPDRVFVWNRFQVEECRKYHGMDPSNVVVTGAQVFDDWFSSKPEYSLEEMCHILGLSKVEPYILYTCSSSFIAPVEVGFVQRWLTAVRQEHSLRDANVVLRPHPQNAAQWNDSNLPGEKERTTVVYPRAGQYVDSADSRNFYFSLLFHARAVIGINTSAMVESGILDKPVFTIRDPEFRLTQEGTLHFKYLIHEGLATESSDIETHVKALAQRLQGETAEQRSVRHAFVRDFLRPCGVGRPAGPILAEEIQRALVEIMPKPRPAPVLARALRVLIEQAAGAKTLPNPERVMV